MSLLIQTFLGLKHLTHGLQLSPKVDIVSLTTRCFCSSLYIQHFKSLKSTYAVFHLSISIGLSISIWVQENKFGCTSDYFKTLFSTFLDSGLRKAMGEQATALAKAVGYDSAGKWLLFWVTAYPQPSISSIKENVN